MPAKAKQAASDSPPVELPRRSLKRTASTASLPTPPRTIKKTTRARSRGSAFESDSEDDFARAPKGKVLFAGNKRRRTGLDALASAIAGTKSADPFAAAEDAFWMGDGGRAVGGPLGTILESPPDLPQSRSEDDKSPAKAVSPAKGSSVTKKGSAKKTSSVRKSASPGKAAPRSKESTAPPSTRVRAPISPPPSRRRTQTVKRTLPLVAPVTPPRRSTRVVSRGKTPTPGPVRDSGNNPFLIESDESPESVEASPVQPRTPTPHVEKATLTYVFRGVKTTFANPLYQVDPEEHARSLLHPDDPDFEPTELCPPRLLFPQARRVQPPRRAKATPSPAAMTRVPRTPTRIPRTPPPRRRAHDHDDDEEEVEVAHKLPKKLVFAVDGLDEPRRSAGRSVNPDALVKAIGPVRTGLRRSPRRAH